MVWHGITGNGKLGISFYLGFCCFCALSFGCSSPWNVWLNKKQARDVACNVLFWASKNSSIA